MSCLQHTACQSSHLTKGNYADFQCLWKYDFFIICSQIPRIWGWCKYVSEKWRNFLSGSCKAHRVYISVDKIHDSKMQLRIREKLNNLHFWVFFPFSCLFFFFTRQCQCPLFSSLLHSGFFSATFPECKTKQHLNQAF